MIEDATAKPGDGRPARPAATTTTAAAALEDWRTTTLPVQQEWRAAPTEQGWRASAAAPPAAEAAPEEPKTPSWRDRARAGPPPRG